MTATVTPNARWEINAPQDGLVLNYDGEYVQPDPLAIWEAQFEGRTQIAGLIVASPSQDVDQVEFSRFTIETVLTARGQVGANLHIGISVNIEGDYVELRQSDAGQVLYKGCWFYIDPAPVAATIKILSGNNIPLQHQLTLGQLISLRVKQDLPIAFVDLTEERQLHTSRVDTIPNLGLSPGTVLFPYQNIGVRFLISVAGESLGCILADEMGLGKTLQVIALLSVEKSQQRSRNLIICPATLLENWRRELSLFAPHLSTLIHSGGRRTGNPAVFEKFDIVITSYETAVRDEHLLSAKVWNILALDEAQNIKNPNAQRTQAVKQLNRRVSLAITGTPVENKLNDLWSIADFALPSLLGSQRDFECSYNDTDEDAARLRPLVAPIILRRRVAEVATDLPLRIDIPQVMKMPRKMAAQYENIRREIAKEYGASTTLVALGKMRQFCTHPELLGFDCSDPAKEMPKYIRLLEILEEIFERNEKALIFSSYIGMADIFMKDIPTRFPRAFIDFIDSRKTVEERQPLIDRFSSYQGYGVLALNPKAAGVGLNITAANHVVHYTPEWNPAVEDQASARAHRRTQTRPVTVHHLYFADTVEEVVVERLRLKRNLAAGAVVGHTGVSDAVDIARALKISPLADLD